MWHDNQIKMMGGCLFVIGGYRDRRVVVRMLADNGRNKGGLPTGGWMNESGGGATNEEGRDGERSRMQMRTRSNRE